jgi:hypothetical protein
MISDWNKVLWTNESEFVMFNNKLWEEVQRRLNKEGKTTSPDDLWAKIQHVWNNIPPETLKKLVDRMPSTCKAVIKAKGGAFDEKTDVRKEKAKQHKK